MILKEADNIRLNFAKAGFKRAPELDFSDDGTRFYGYIHRSGMPMTYASSRGDAYISLRPDYLKDLNYEEYSKLPSYDDSDMYNGVSKAEVDMNRLDQLATQLMKEYNEAVENLEPVSDDSFEKIVDEAKNRAAEKYKNASNLVKNNFDKLLELSDYNSKRVIEYLKALKRRVYEIGNHSRNVSDGMKRKILSKGVDYLCQPEEKDFYSKEIYEIMS